jgi:FixJ family two-component response regulator
MDVRREAMRCLMVAEKHCQPAEMVGLLLEEQGLRLRWAGEGQECLHLLDRADWGLLVFDASGSSHGALSLLSQVRKTHPDLPILVLVHSGHVATAVEAMKAGAADCIEIPIEPARLLSTVAQLRRVIDCHSLEPVAELTPTERVVLHHVLEGRTTRGIAAALSRSPRTIEVHRSSIMRKLRVSNLAGLMKQAMHAGL